MSQSFKLNRFFSNQITPFLLKTSLTPNHVTLLSLAAGLAGGYFFSRGNYGSSLMGALLFNTAAILDNCDGDIARAKNMRSEFGGWLDVFCDLLVDFALFGGLAYGLYKVHPDKLVIVFAALCLSGSLLNGLLVAWEKIKGFGPAVFNQSNPSGSGREHWTFKVADAVREGDSSWFVVILALLGLSEYLLWAGGIYMQILWISSFVMNYRWLLGKKAQ